MKRGYKYEKEMLHWLDGGEIEQRWEDEDCWYPFDGRWKDTPYWEYRIVEPAEKPKEERWLYVVDVGGFLQLHESEIRTYTIGKIRMEDV
jgi:elongation factor P hydroxylase